MGQHVQAVSEFKRRRGETGAHWRGRLAGVDASALTPDALDELTLRRVEACRAARRARKRGASSDLRRCWESARSLAPEDRRRLAQWLRDGMTD